LVCIEKDTRTELREKRGVPRKFEKKEESDLRIVGKRKRKHSSPIIKRGTRDRRPRKDKFQRERGEKGLNTSGGSPFPTKVNLKNKRKRKRGPFRRKRKDWPELLKSRIGGKAGPHP